ncbi:MAG: hypothetical protein LUH51_02490 [Firmicutes bacterium]|nr:hypothetical protein [Bacillota bacterium]
MKCAWHELTACLPLWLAREAERIGAESLQEIRLRVGQAAELVTGSVSIWTKQSVRREDITTIVNAASQYSPWARQTLAQGYLSLPGGHRLGLCGRAILREGRMEGLSELSSACLRVAKAYPGIADGLPLGGSLLILGAPGSGKTTLLREFIRRVAAQEEICAVDEREELFALGHFEPGQRLDVLSQCPKREGIFTVLKTMGPKWIAVDEITSEEDCLALMQAGRCGVKLAATVHAAQLRDLELRPLFRELGIARLFDTFAVLGPDKRYRLERSKP